MGVLQGHKEPNISGIIMKKNSIIFNLMGVILCGLTMPAAADVCGQNFSECCEWSVLDGKMTLGADWLYWKVQQDGISPGSVVVSSDPTVTPPTTHSHKIHPDFQYESGFRVNLGYELPCDCWDIDLAYTYMPSHAKTHRFVSASELEIFSPVASPVFGSTTFTSKWDLTSNNIDLDIGRTVSLGECLKLRPHIGFRATWFDQKYRSFSFLSTTGATEALVLKEKFQGYGVEGGLWADWNLGCGLSLVGHVGGSVLYSKFKIHGDTLSGILVEDVLELQTLTSSSDCFYSGTPMIDYFVGLQYADNFCDMLFKAYVGWEQHILFDTNRYLSSGNLSAQGLTLGLDVGF